MSRDQAADRVATARSQAGRHDDWAASFGGWLRAWGIPSLILIAAAMAEPMTRALVWSGVLIWMGLACLVNARRCGRTHCRYTGPYYFLLIVPVLSHGLSVVSLGPWAWWALGALILLGSKLIWLGSEWRWGRYTPRR